jgi:hypothetical protein
MTIATPLPTSADPARPAAAPNRHRITWVLILLAVAATAILVATVVGNRDDIDVPPAGATADGPALYDYSIVARDHLLATDPGGDLLDRSITARDR